MTTFQPTMIKQGKVITATMRVWDLEDKQKVVECKCKHCNKIFRERQAQNDCVRMGSRGDNSVWIETDICLKCEMLEEPKKEEMDINTKFALMFIAKSIIEERTGTKL